MQRNHSLSVLTTFVLAGTLGLSACAPQEEGTSCAEANYDAVDSLEAGVLGTVVDSIGIPLAGVRVFVPGKPIEAFTDANGRFNIAVESLADITADSAGNKSIQIWTEFDGYPDKVQQVSVPADMVADVLIYLKKYDQTEVVESEVGGIVSDGTSRVTFLPNAFMDAETGDVVTGPVQVSVLTYRPYVDEDMKAAPGELTGSYQERSADGTLATNPDGTPRMVTSTILSTGMLDVLMMQDGRKLELRPGYEADVELQDIVKGTWDQDAIDRFMDEHVDTFSEEDLERQLPKTDLWHFNYESGIWDKVEGYQWDSMPGTKEGFLSARSLVPAFSPANKDAIVQQYETTDLPLVTCLCKNLKHGNGTQNVRGADIKLTSKANAYKYLVTVWNDGSVDKSLISTEEQTLITNTRTDQQGNFCGNTIVDPYSQSGSAKVDSTKTYWPGRTMSNTADCQIKDTTSNCQYQDYDRDGELDDNNDGKIDLENIVGYLGDTYYDRWTVSLSGVRSCGSPQSPSLPVQCVNEPTDPVTGQQPN